MSTAARIDELRKKFEENPRRYFAPLANELRKAGNLSEAIALCREFLPKQPEHMSGYIVFGQALYESGDLSEARTVFEQALALDPENLKALRHLGDIAKWEGDTAGARRWYERVLEADPRNDDIAAQLATLATPAHVVPVVPESIAPATPWAVASPTPAFSPSFTPPLSMAPIGMGAIPTPDAALRAVDFDQINARLRETDPSTTEQRPESDAAAEQNGEEEPSAEPSPAPELLDLDAIEAAGEEWQEQMAEVAVETPVDAPVDATVEATVESEADDPFGFTGEPSDLGYDADTAEMPFEEGLIAPEWPDTADLVSRVSTPRSVTPSFVAALTPDAVAAFGAEPGESVPTAPAESDDAFLVAPDSPDAEVAEVEEVVAEMAEMDAVIIPPMEVTTASSSAAHDYMDHDELDDAEPEWIVTPVTESAASADDELPWLAPTPEPVSEPVMEPVSEPVMETEIEEAVVAPTSLFDEASFDAMEAELDPEADVVEASFADVMPDEHNPAFVTETMGELLVSQGFTARAISVYEELVRRRPYDPVLTSRLGELHEQLAAETPVAPDLPTPAASLLTVPTPVSSPVPDVAPFAEAPIARVTARERFAELAARRVPRRTPPRATVAVETPAEGLESLFGGEAALNEDAAARALADAFAPIDESGRIGDDLPFEKAMLGGASRSPTPMRSATPIATAAVGEGAGGPFSFDRFFPDPATGESPHDTPTHSPANASSLTPASTPSAHVAPPTVSDDLAQFSAWLKGLGNS